MPKKNGRFHCARCQRSFSMAAHLGRHMATIHGTTPRPALLPIPARRRGRPPKAVDVMPSATRRLLGQVQSWRAALTLQQARLEAQMQALGQLAAALTGAAMSPRAPIAQLSRSGRGRRTREGALKTFIERVLRENGQPMRVSAVAAAVRQAGYATQNKSFAKSVGAALAEMPAVAKVDRGLFRAK